MLDQSSRTSREENLKWDAKTPAERQKISEGNGLYGTSFDVPGLVVCARDVATIRGEVAQGRGK
jgi:hypothetical protein